jgi:hypothetical protein
MCENASVDADSSISVTLIKNPDILMCQLGAGKGIKEGISGGEEPSVSTKT